jgi:hypothetical protein
MKENKKSSFDVERMSKETGLPIVVIKKALNIPLNGVCAATTIDEAMEAYKSAPECSEEGELALQKLNELFILKFKKAATWDEVTAIQDEILIVNAIEAIRFGDMRLVEVSTSLDQLSSLESLSTFPETRAFASKKLNEAYLVEINKAETREDFIKIISLAPQESSNLAIKRFANSYGWQE